MRKVYEELQRLLESKDGDGMIMTEEEMDEQLELMEEYEPRDDDDRCYECQGYGDDYSEDEEGNLVSNCTDYPWNSANDDEW